LLKLSDLEFKKLDRVLSGGLLSLKGSGELERRLKLAGEGLEMVDDVLWDLGSWLRPVMIFVVKLCQRVREFVAPSQRIGYRHSPERLSLVCLADPPIKVWSSCYCMMERWELMWAKMPPPIIPEDGPLRSHSTPTRSQ